MTIEQQFIAYKTIARRELTRILRIWPQTICPTLITSSLFLLVLGKIIGQHISHSTSTPYIEFIIPGLLMMAIIMNSYENAVSSFFLMKFVKSIDELLVSTSKPYVVMAGYISGSLFRSLVVGSLVYLTSLFFVNIPVSHLALMITVSLLTSIIFALCGLINAFFANNFDEIAWLPSFVLVPLNYLGGVFYDASNISSFWKILFDLNPISHLMKIFRYAFIGGTEYNYLPTLLIMLVIAISLFTLACYMYRKGINLKS